MNDTELLRMMKESPEAGYRALFEAYHRYVYAIIFRIMRGCGTSKDIEDSVEDVFADVLLHFDTLRTSTLRAYIGTAAKHKALNLRKSLMPRNGAHVPLDELQDFPSGERVEELAEYSELTGILLDKIESLGEPDSVIILQRYFYDRKFKEIAPLVGLSPAAANVRCSRAVKRLRKMLKDLDITL